ncbi:hypothetical protein H4R21_000284 [Coemansia helicoidea]|uniref:Uncharacterized protein n=1 Tax=Coemansia helicoidea TaxID=1286919 RepID=A0ACC1LGB9_9FUNG|nr:hypothetical protein H4R21_000284 [Coemansia helicoidea]
MPLRELPFPATGAPLPDMVAQALRSLDGPRYDKHSVRYVPAPPLERSCYAACPTCGSSFGLFRRRNNCGNCGLVVCADCLASRWYLPKYGYATPVPCCLMCNRNLAISMMGKEELRRCSVRELRGYLTMYGLYSPSMIEKADLVAAAFANSPMPQKNEQHYRDCLPRPSCPARHAGRQSQPQGTGGSGGDSSNPPDAGLWETMFAQIERGIGHGLESMEQHIGGGIGQRFENIRSSGVGGPGGAAATGPSPSPPRSHGTPERAPERERHTYSHTHTRSHSRLRPQAPQSQQPPRPRSVQGDRAPSTAAAGDTAPSPARTGCPDIKALARDGADPSTLSIKALKAVLAANHVDYSGIVEKRELVQRVALLISNTRLEMASAGAPSSDDPARFEENTCKICWDAVTNCVFLNCGHMCTCLECGNKIVASDRRECPICREHIARVVHVFRA